MADVAQQPLQGVKVLDLGRALAGPLCSLMLGDLGADIIKIEPPGLGDDSRAWPPFQNGESTYFVSANRNKRSIVLDLGKEEGRDVFRKMVASADVVVENYRHGVMDGWGIGYEALRELNPALIYCAITGFGRSGPYATKPATDIYMQAFGGLMSVTGEVDGGPIRTGVSICDLTTGMFASLGVTAALQARNITGTGQLVDTSLLDGQVTYLSYLLTAFGATNEVPVKSGSGHPSVVPYQAFQASDGWVSLAAFNDRIWRRAAIAMELEDLVSNPLFTTNVDRVKNRDTLIPILQERFLTKSVQEWVSIMENNDVPLAPVNTVEEVMKHPQVIHREMVQEIEHPTAGKFSVFGFPMKFSDTPCAYRYPPPALGQHSDEILGEFGYSEQEIAELSGKSVISTAKE
ncbi:CaiB/BaiF CoA transferase family protein [Sneathiella litorea]|uniref:CoA transferase n=1 Tax=Sneathiella litorea TaxID=2606216 RepID=A0A6L8W2M3_9PROT|nr:CoA transferase [Sneathiella litorea]MZR29188.1 CoA transferase [Sneathiella litorea]